MENKIPGQNNLAQNNNNIQNNFNPANNSNSLIIPQQQGNQAQSSFMALINKINFLEVIDKF